MTVGANGDEGAAIFNSALANLIGVFITPMWVWLLLRQSSNISLFDVVSKLVLKVVVPLAVGQFSQHKLPTVKAFAFRNKKNTRIVQELCLVFVVYTVFCVTFSSKSEASFQDILVMAILQVGLLLLAKAIAWVYLRLLFPEEPALRVTGLFGALLCVFIICDNCSHHSFVCRLCSKNSCCRDPTFAGHVRRRFPTGHV